MKKEREIFVDVLKGSFEKSEKRECKMKTPWDKGNEGWENYADFVEWLKGEMGNLHDDWCDDSPTLLMTVFEKVCKQKEKGGK